MAQHERLKNGPLTVYESEDEGSISYYFRGKSIVRSPTDSLQPFLFEVLDEADRGGRRLVLDFRPLTYMNSSSFTPIIKALERARLRESKVTVLYDPAKKWQAVSFVALLIFETPDGRISVAGS